MAKQWKIYKKELVNNEKDFLKYTSKPTHITHKVFDRNYAAIHEIKPVLTLNKPIYVGFIIYLIYNSTINALWKFQYMQLVILK